MGELGASPEICPTMDDVHPAPEVAPAKTKLGGSDFEKQLDIDKDFPEFRGWESIGFHRGLGREFWQLILELISTSTTIFIVSLLMPIIQPYPEIVGYQNIAGGLFTLIYTIFNLGTNFGLNRFIAEYRVKNVRRMLQYVSFTLWYQSFTGLVQISILTWFTFEVVVHTEYAYVTWILLLGLQKEYPGWFGLFRQTLEGMQHFDKVEILSFMQSKVVERLTTIGFVLIFRWFGDTNPAYGVLMGILLGNVIGTYVDDIAFEFLSAYYLNKILKKYFGLSLRDAFRAKYDREVLHDIWVYGLQGSLLPILDSFVGTYALLVYVANIPAYATWAGLIATGMSFASQVNQFGDFALETAIAESYPNGKRKLAEFYVSCSIKWRCFFMIMLSFVILGVVPFFAVAVQELSAFQNYQRAEMFIIPGIISRFLWAFVLVPDAIMWGAKRISQHTAIRVAEDICKLFFTWLFVIVLRVQVTWGIVGLVFLIGFQDMVAIWIKTLACFWYIEKRILHVNIYWWTTFIVPVLASLPNIALAQFWYYTAFFPLKDALGLEVTLALSIAIYFIIIVFTYFPLCALLGGFDDYQVFVFRKAVDLAGPSKPIFRAVLKLIDANVKRARKWGWHGRFPIPYEDAHREIRELMEIKRTALKANSPNLN